MEILPTTATEEARDPRWARAEVALLPPPRPSPWARLLAWCWRIVRKHMGPPTR